MTTTHLNVDNIGTVELTFTDQGTGTPILLLHGGAGPQSVSGFADLLAKSHGVRVVTPTLPGFNGTPRPEALQDAAGLARTCVALLEKLDLSGVTVVGNSVGGWIAAELATLNPARVKGVVLVSATGIEVAGHPVADVFTLTPDELSRLSFHQPERFRIDPAALPPERRAIMVANRQMLARYAGRGFDPTLQGRLAAIRMPTLLLWGASDRVVDTEYGRAYAAAIPGATFRGMPETGHVPSLETPELLAGEVIRFVAGG